MRDPELGDALVCFVCHGNCGKVDGNYMASFKAWDINAKIESYDGEEDAFFSYDGCEDASLDY